ncbi:hypothetical protein [Mycolicibacterium mucogenicum]|uniref:Uncharacterized protein n=1 Tax=Mycolicibacterium mucogenicum DSM 44124 TaxID=1226753 RepID=A0A8H2PJU7_MYCMU|nr:hypothetical protein [Mycolicibacterium mucogenicum]KAB7755203.1 hypothetical protein MMUC44124_20685 [Mycolicibacterium mucogenicum DSM 44124]QPG68885.1 hypothetical protein C1S78_026290 [Mycolicibacterium mucogenicum DSM 44124]
MVSLARYFPLPFTCQHEAYKPGAVNGHGNATPDWDDPVPVACSWWDPTSTEPAQGPTGGDIVIADRVLVVDAAVSVDQRDRFTFATNKVDGNGNPVSVRFEVSGLPHDFNHGPFGYAPRRLVVELKRVG